MKLLCINIWQKTTVVACKQEKEQACNFKNIWHHVCTAKVLLLMERSKAKSSAMQKTCCTARIRQVLQVNFGQRAAVLYKVTECQPSLRQRPQVSYKQDHTQRNRRSSLPVQRVGCSGAQRILVLLWRSLLDLQSRRVCLSRCHLHRFTFIFSIACKACLQYCTSF